MLRRNLFVIFLVSMCIALNFQVFADESTYPITEINSDNLLVMEFELEKIVAGDSVIYDSATDNLINERFIQITWTQFYTTTEITETAKGVYTYAITPYGFSIGNDKLDYMSIRTSIFDNESSKKIVEVAPLHKYLIGTAPVKFNKVTLPSVSSSARFTIDINYSEKGIRYHYSATGQIDGLKGKVIKD